MIWVRSPRSGPRADGTIPPANLPAGFIGTPGHAVHGPAMPRNTLGGVPPLSRPPPRLVTSVSVRPDQLRAVRTPVEVDEGGGVALQDPQRLATLHVPQTHSAIATATEQVAAIGVKARLTHRRYVLQHHPELPSSVIPQPDRVVKAALPACLHPDSRPVLHPLRMPHKRLETASAFGVPTA